jgi:hypothetical protein
MATITIQFPLSENNNKNHYYIVDHRTYKRLNIGDILTSPSGKTYMKIVNTTEKTHVIQDIDILYTREEFRNLSGNHRKTLLDNKLNIIPHLIVRTTQDEDGLFPEIHITTACKKVDDMKRLYN